MIWKVCHPLPIFFAGGRGWPMVTATDLMRAATAGVAASAIAASSDRFVLVSCACVSWAYSNCPMRLSADPGSRSCKKLVAAAQMWAGSGASSLRVIEVAHTSVDMYAVGLAG